jgi:DNA-binding IclR family transcriptional regulator
VKVQPTTIQSLARGIALLEAIARGGRPRSAQELAAAMGLHLATTYHLLRTLVATGYVWKEGRLYRLGSKISELSAAYERELRPDPAALEAMHELASTLGETVYVSRWQHGDVTISAVVEGVHAVRVAGVYIGLRGHAYARASGKSLLAFGPDERLAYYLAATSLEALTPNTITDVSRLQAELAQTRRRGYAVDREEFAVGVCCIAAPITDGSRPANTALTVSFPASRLQSLREAVVPALLATAARAGRSTSEAA